MDLRKCIFNIPQPYVEIREIDPLSVIVPISKIRKPHLPIGLNIWNTLYRADVPSKKWFRIVFREDQPSTKEQPEGAREPEWRRDAQPKIGGGISPHISRTAALFVVLVGCIKILTTAALTENGRARRGFDLFAWF